MPLMIATDAADFWSDLRIAETGQGLLDRTLPKESWTHAAHLAAAAWIIAACPQLLPERDMPAIIRAYNEATGVANTDSAGYHETITLASLLAVGAVLAAQTPGTPLSVAFRQLMLSPFGDKQWLLKYWRAEVLFSIAARRAWVAPDLAPLPF